MPSSAAIITIRIASSISRATRNRSRVFKNTKLNPYLEYGLTKEWTVGASLFIDDLSQKDGLGGTETNQGLGNSQLFARTTLWQKQAITLSAEPFIGLPALYRSNREPQSGHENFDAGAYLALGDSGSWIGEHDYAELRAGYRHRFGVLGDQAVIEAKAGLNLLRDFTLIPEVDFTLPLDGIDNSRRSVSGDNDYRLTRLQLSGVYDIDPVWSVQAGLFTHVAGENTGAGGGGMLSVWHHF